MGMEVNGQSFVILSWEYSRICFHPESTGIFLLHLCHLTSTHRLVNPAMGLIFSLAAQLKLQARLPKRD
jgi:hypothetical protein